MLTEGDIGLIFHWGLYSVPAFDDVISAQRRKLQNGSEWYKKRLLESGNYRPISGYKETQKYHEENYGEQEYEDFIDDFNPNIKNMEKWMKFAVQIGAKYVILTAKHHDGFCLWNTKTTDFKAKIDLISIFKKLAEKYELLFGIYYSLSEFDKNCTILYMKTIVIPQITELQTYKPDIFWFDGHWQFKTKFAKESMIKIIKCLKKMNPSIEINDRTSEKFESENDLGNSTFRVYSDRYIPEKIPKVKWEHINTIGLSWGINKQQEKKDYKSGKELFTLYSKVRSLKGRFLINLGPDNTGKLDINEQKSLIEFGKILNG